jgi:hypothetical protein
MPRPHKFAGTAKPSNPVPKAVNLPTYHVCIRLKAGGTFHGDGVRKTMHRTDDRAEAEGLARAYSFAADPHVHEERP